MSVWIISKIHALRLTSFFIFLTYFPFMQSMHCFKSENSNGGRIDLLINRSILPSKYGLNDSAIISMIYHELFFAYFLHL